MLDARAGLRSRYSKKGMLAVANLLQRSCWNDRGDGSKYETAFVLCQVSIAELTGDNGLAATAAGPFSPDIWGVFSCQDGPCKHALMGALVKIDRLEREWKWGTSIPKDGVTAGSFYHGIVTFGNKL